MGTRSLLRESDVCAEVLEASNCGNGLEARAEVPKFPKKNLARFLDVNVGAQAGVELLGESQQVFCLNWALHDEKAIIEIGEALD